MAAPQSRQTVKSSRKSMNLKWVPKGWRRRDRDLTAVRRRRRGLETGNGNAGWGLETGWR
ncbi:hypothetical protein E2562_020113, partial [Oryza meyeriana var. granulata]